MARALRAVHHEEALGVEAAALDAAPRCAARRSPSSSGVKRLKSGAIQRGNDHHQHQRERDPREPRVEPPAAGPAALDQPEDAEQERRAERGGEQQRPSRGRARKSRGVVRLKPWRASITKVRHSVEGQGGERARRASRRRRWRGRAA